MGTHVETLPARQGSTRARAVAGAIVLLIAALGAGFAVGRATGTTAEPAEPAAPAEPAPLGLASAEVVAAVDAGIEAWNAFDENAVATSYTVGAVFDDLIAGEVSEGIDQITEKVTRYEPDPWGIERVSEVVQTGDFAAYAFTYNGPGEGVAVLELDSDLKITHQWVMGV